MKLSSLLNEICKLDVPYANDKVQLSYKPGTYTPEFESQIDEAAESKDADKLSQLMAGLVIEWDLYGDDGKAYPLDVASLRKLPVRFLAAVLRAIIKDFSPN